MNLSFKLYCKESIQNSASATLVHYDLDRFTDSMDQILVCLKPVYETHSDFLEAQKIIDEIRMHSNFINKMLLMDLYQNYDEEDQS